MVDDNPTTEHWLPIPGYEGLYEVSDLGRIRTNWYKKVGRILKPCTVTRKGRGGTGYRKVILTGPPRRDWLVHRLVALAFLGPCPDGMEINHINSDSCDNRLVNLEYVTHQTNQRHAAAHARYPRGSHHFRARLSEDDVRSIKARLAAGESQASIARTLPVAYSTVKSVACGRSWSHIS